MQHNIATGENKRDIMSQPENDDHELSDLDSLLNHISKELIELDSRFDDYQASPKTEIKVDDCDDFVVKDIVTTSLEQVSGGVELVQHQETHQLLSSNDNAVPKARIDLIPFDFLTPRQVAQFFEQKGIDGTDQELLSDQRLHPCLLPPLEPKLLACMRFLTSLSSLRTEGIFRKSGLKGNALQISNLLSLCNHSHHQ